MLRARKLSLAGIAVGALALTVSTSVPLAYGHGYTTGPTSRAKHCQNGTVQNCGQIQWEPQSVEGPKGSRRPVRPTASSAPPGWPSSPSWMISVGERGRRSSCRPVRTTTSAGT